MAENEYTTKFKIEIWELKKNMQEAARQVRLANAEFKEATAGMDNWGESADGLSAKVKQLDTVLAEQKKQLDILEKQYELTAKAMGEDSKQAQELNIKIANQKATIKNTEAQLGKYKNALKDIENSSKDANSELKKLESAITEQEEELKKVKTAYEEAALSQGKNSTEAKELAKKLSELSGELKQNKDKLAEVSKAADELDKSIEDAGNSAKDSEEGFTVMKGALANLLADGIRAVAGELKDFVVETESAYNKFQAQTGASAVEMEKFKDEMNDMYSSAFGDSLEDIGDKMAYVKQVTGEVDPSKIRELTENAMTLEDTFGTDFNETIRGTTNLMTHFGIDAQEAFDLYSKGCQEGLDYTGELGDNIAEYGGNFQQAGYTTEEYFQLLKNGTENGAYNLDKVNDSINEVKNRLADGSIEENIGQFSENTQTLFANWQNGQGTMKDVINSIVNDINNCTNEQEALTMAATAFGTMGEDANLKVVKSLTTVGDDFKSVKGTMESVKKIRYDDVGTQFKELGRTMNQKLLLPLAEKALPYFKELGNTAIENIDKIIPAAKVLGTTIAGVFVINKIAGFVGSLNTIITTFKTLKTATDAAKVSQLGLNAAWLASPAGLATVAVAGLGAGLAYLVKQDQKAIEAEFALTDAQKENIEAINERAEAYKQMEETRNTSVEGIVAEYGYLDELKTELQGLIDSNGQVKAGYEDRANFIVNQLATALGIEKEKIWEIINSNGDLGESIDQIIEKKKAEALLNANEEMYQEAIKGRTAALQEYQEQLAIYDEEKKKLEECQKAVAEHERLLAGGDLDGAAEFYNRNRVLIEGLDTQKETFDKVKDAVKEAEDTYVGYNAQIQNYEGLSSAIISGDAAKIQEAMLNTQYSFITAETGTKQSLENQVKNLQKNYEDMKTAIANNTPGVTQEMVDQAKQMVDQATIELNKLIPNAQISGINAGNANANGMMSTIDNNAYVAASIADRLKAELGAPDTSETGASKIGEYVSGMGSQMGTVTATGRALGQAGADAAGEADYYSVGSNGGQGLINGLNSTMQSIKDTATNMAANIIKSLKEGLDEHSPSKETFQIGDYAVLGLVNALAAGARKVIAPTKEIAKSIIDTAGEELGDGIGIPDLANVKGSVNAAGNTAKSGRVVNNSTSTVTYQFNQTNNSPKSLSQLDIYRQTKNLLNVHGGVK